jgi:hypothetical protein
MTWVGTPYFLVVLRYMWTSDEIDLAKKLVWHMSK